MGQGNRRWDKRMGRERRERDGGRDTSHCCLYMTFWVKYTGAELVCGDY